MIDLKNNKLSPIPHNYISQIENYVPGKAKILGSQSEVIKLSSNENALGASKKAIAGYIDHAHELYRYADGSCSLLRKKLAQKNNIDYQRIVCSAGSDELIALLTSSYAGVGDEVIYSQYGFLMYPISAQRVGAVAVKVEEQNLKCDVKAIAKAVTNKTKIIFIANPNNPTGSYLNSDEIKWLIANIPKHVLLVLDHAYEEYVKVNDYPDALKLVSENSNVVMLRTFSKIYGLASLRIGWCYCSEQIAEVLNKVRGPFNVSGPAQVGALCSLDDDEFVEKSISHNQKWLEKYFTKISCLTKVKAYPAIANFILLDFFSPLNCQKAQELFLQNAIILREMKAYGLDNCLRLTIGNDQENSKVLSILAENFQ